MMLDFIGAPQIAALLILLQRGCEELYSARNTRALLALGAYEVGRDYYPVVAATHLAWIASLFCLVPPHAPTLWPLIVYYLVLQIARYWVIASLGGYWTHRIITFPSGRLIKSGAYRYLRHPNYAIAIVETFVLPLAFAAIALAVIMTALWWTVLAYKIKLEDHTLDARRAAGNGGTESQRSREEGHLTTNTGHGARCTMRSARLPMRRS
jgi:methyltransferase